MTRVQKYYIKKTFPVVWRSNIPHTMSRCQRHPTPGIPTCYHIIHYSLHKISNLSFCFGSVIVKVHSHNEQISQSQVTFLTKNCLSKLQQNFHAGRSKLSQTGSLHSHSRHPNAAWMIPTACVWNSLSLNHYNT